MVLRHCFVVTGAAAAADRIRSLRLRRTVPRRPKLEFVGVAPLVVILRVPYAIQPEHEPHILYCYLLRACYLLVRSSNWNSIFRSVE